MGLGLSVFWRVFLNNDKKKKKKVGIEFHSMLQESCSCGKVFVVTFSPKFNHYF